MTTKFRFGNFTYYASVGYYADGRPGEVFLDCAKTGSMLRDSTRESAILLSLALQHGAQVETLKGAISRDENGQPVSAIGYVIENLLEPLP